MFSRYIDAVKGSLIAIVIFSVATYVIPTSENAEGVELILTVSTFLFAILAGFFLSRLNSRYDQIRETVSSEDAIWASLYNVASFYGDKFVKKLEDIIDKYYIVAFDYDVGNYYKHNMSSFRSVYDELKKVDLKSNLKKNDLFDDMLSLLSQIEEKRNKSSVLAKEKLTTGQWMVLLSLSMIIIYCVFVLRTPDIYSQCTAVVFSTAMILVMLILRDLQNLNHGGETIAVESGQEIFELIGRTRYYNKKHIDRGIVKIPEFVNEYRLGLHDPGDEFEIEEVSRKTKV